MLRKTLRDQKGISTVELIPVLLVFALLFNFALGFFGVIHSGILNSIAARNYAFETFRHRPNLTYFRDVAGMDKEARYSKINYRFHGAIGEGHGSENEWIATIRPIKFTDVQQGVNEPIGTGEEHNTLVRQIADDGKASDIFTGKTADDGRSGLSPVWVQTIYGMCLSSKCMK